VFPYSSHTLARILRDTLRGAGQSIDLDACDQGVLELRRNLMIRIAALEDEASGLEIDDDASPIAELSELTSPTDSAELMCI
jgi:hypothetical protein